MECHYADQDSKHSYNSLKFYHAGNYSLFREDILGFIKVWSTWYEVVLTPVADPPPPEPYTVGFLLVIF